MKDKEFRDSTTDGSGRRPSSAGIVPDQSVFKALVTGVMVGGVVIAAPGALPTTPLLENPPASPSKLVSQPVTPQPASTSLDYFSLRRPSLQTPATTESATTESATKSATTEELEALLKNYDTQFLIDDSGSMRLSTSTVSVGKTHWDEVKDVTMSIVKKCAPDGVDVYFFNSLLVGQYKGLDIKTPEAVMKLFEDRWEDGIRGSTPTAEALDLIITPYLNDCENTHKEQNKFPKPRNIIVMTDGAANNNNLLRQNLISYARRLDAMKAPTDQIGIQFFQVGKVEGVGKFFEYLDNALGMEVGCRDFIETESTEKLKDGGLTAVKVLETVLGGVNRRLDDSRRSRV